MTEQTRAYTKKRRAELEAGTRMRITESAVELHGSVGPARSTISAVAEGAGVRRSTVYRHFPDETALFIACSSHWAEANPFPDIGSWARIDDPDERLRTALNELYAHYRRTEGMMDNILRDEATMPIIERMLGAYRQYLDAARDTLVKGRQVRGRARRTVLAAIGHSLAFATWRSLAREQGLDDVRAAELMCRLASSAAVGGLGNRN
jgi:AcrR family transcriptional regulator